MNFEDNVSERVPHVCRTCDAAGPLRQVVGAGSCVDGQLILLKFQQLLGPVADVRILVIYTLRGPTKPQKANVCADGDPFLL